MRMKERLNGDVVVLELLGDVMLGEDRETMLFVIARLVQDGERDIILDMQRVRRINDAGVGILLNAYALAARLGARMRMVGLTPRAGSPLHVNRLLEVFDAQPNLEAAKTSLHSERELLLCRYADCN